MCAPFEAAKKEVSDVAENILEIRDLTKLYPGVVALNHVTMSFQKGEVHAIVGENGAGKSTLIKSITGCIEPTRGTIVYDGTLYKRLNPIEAIKKGIGAVYQEFNLIPYLSVAENIFYKREKKKNLFIDYNAMYAETADIMKTLGVQVNPKARVMNLSVAYQQIVEIAKSVSRDVKLLILDEPSAPLTAPEIQSMFRIIRTLKEKGVTILYISHRLEEIFEIADRVSVMRDGEYITTLDTAKTNRQALIQLMVGRELVNTYPERQSPIGDVVLEVEGLTNKRLHNVSFNLKKGEILGLGGLVGAGRTECARAIFGADPIACGTITLNGKPVRIKSPKQAIGYRIGLIPEDRKRHGVLLGLPVSRNITFSNLKEISSYGWIHTKKEAELVKTQIRDLQIKTPSSDQLVKNLSGGNQQKVVLAKWLATKCDILIFDEPTRGIDVGAKQEIYKLMRNLSHAGLSIIMISSEMPELLGMSDRIVVMHEGFVTGEIDSREATQEAVLDLAYQNPTGGVAL